MFKKLSVFAVSILMLLAMTGFVVAQTYGVLWEDHFEDDDPPAFKNVGWIYYGPDDVPGQVVAQQAGELFVEAGSYFGQIGTGVILTNGVPEIVLDENGNLTPETEAAILADNYSSPNLEVTFLVNFKRFNTNSMFLISARMPLDSSRYDANPVEAPGYPLMLDPLNGVVTIAKYEGPLAALQPDIWTYLAAPAGFAFDLEVYYWVKYYLKDGDIKAKIWEGELSDEPTEWLIQGVDPAPRAVGNFLMIGTLGQKPDLGQGDQFILDDIVVRATTPGAEVSEGDIFSPTDFSLTQNYPNPFNPNTSIAFALPENNMTQLVIYNTMGQVVRTLVNSEMAAGSHRLTWDGLDENHNPVTSGIYIYRLTSGNNIVSKRMIFMK